MQFKKVTVLLSVLLFVSAGSFAQNNSNILSENMVVNLDTAQLEFAKEAIRLYGDKIPEVAQKAILEQRVLIGMSPYEAKLAAGAFYFKVTADPKHWPPNANPYVVIDRQSVAPDESKIWMTFQTETQYPGEGKKRFTVYFFNGKAQSIEKLSNLNE